MDFDSIRLELEALEEKLNTLKNAIKVEEKKQKVEELEKETFKDGFWDNMKESSKILTDLKGLKADVSKYEKAEEEYNEAKTYLELAQEENDNDSFKEAKRLTTKLTNDLEKLEVSILLSDPYDKNNAIVTIHPGAGGTESQDWALMLYRMYTRWANKAGYKVEELDYLEGDEAGLKSVTFEVIGENAFHNC